MDAKIAPQGVVIAREFAPLMLGRHPDVLGGPELFLGARPFTTAMSAPFSHDTSSPAGLAPRKRIAIPRMTNSG